MIGLLRGSNKNHQIIELEAEVKRLETKVARQAKLIKILKRSVLTLKGVR